MIHVKNKQNSDKLIDMERFKTNKLIRKSSLSNIGFHLVFIFF